MLYDLSEFRERLPVHHQCVVIDPESEVALHVARWPYRSFNDLAGFVRFTYRYSCVLQPFIFDSSRNDLRSWFHADLSADQRAADLLNKNRTTNQEASDWMARFYPGISIDWLNAGVHGKIISLMDGEWPEMLGYDTDGYFCAFAADAT
jgi:hypothetical protein